MASKIAVYLQNHIRGEVLSDTGVRQAFSTDGSLLEMMPQLVVYPRSTNDVRKVARFAWQLAEKGHQLPLTARGFGSDTTGAAIGQGAILSFPSHMGQILELDTKQRLIRVQPGASVSALQETLHTHGLYFPPLQSLMPYTTIGGAIANGASSNVSQGFIQDWIDKLEVVLANGEVIQTGPISRKELTKKKGLPTLEGELYRAVDGVSSDYQDVLGSYSEATSGVLNDNVGYRLRDVIQANGTCDLTPLFIGSQGTLGVISEIILKLRDYEPASSYVVATYKTLTEAAAAALACLEFKPLGVEVFSKALIDEVSKDRGHGVFAALLDEEKPVSTYVTLVELPKTSKKSLFHNHHKAVMKRLSETSTRIAEHDSDQYELIDQLRAYLNAPRYMEAAGKSAVPIVTDCMVPVDALSEFLKKTESLLKKHHLAEAWSCDARTGVIDLWPFIDISRVGGRQKVVTLMNDYFNLVWSVGGTIAGRESDGRMKALYSAKQLGTDLSQAMREIKKAADPHLVMNPGVKIDVDSKRLASLLRKNYSSAARTDLIV